MKYLIFLMVMLPTLAFSQNKPVVAIHNTSGALVFTHIDSSKTTVPKTSFGSIFASTGTSVSFNINYSGQGLKTINAIATQLYYPVFSTADSLLTQVNTWLAQTASNDTIVVSVYDTVLIQSSPYNIPAHYQLNGADTLTIADSTVNSFTMILESGDCTLSINGAAALTYDVVGVYSWQATNLLSYSFEVITGSGDKVKVITITE